MAAKHNHGYNLLELMLAIAVGSIIIAGTYTANVIIAKQYGRISAFSEVEEMGVPSLRLLSRDLKMAGYKALDGTMTSPFGAITTPITITNNPSSTLTDHCDSIQIIYDQDTATRNRYTYFVAERTAAVPASGSTPAILAKDGLFLTIESWNGATWVATATTNALVADYIEDLQFVGSDFDTNGNPRFVDIFMMFRSKSQLPYAVNYTKPAETVGEYNYNITDRYDRNYFSATINIKNLR